MKAPLRVCIAAENASVRMGGEAILPYHYFRLLLERGIDVHLVVHERCREELLELFPADAERLHFVHDRVLQKLLFRLGRLLPRRVAEATLGLATQLLTQRGQKQVLRRLYTPGCVVHQPTPVAPRFPSALSGLPAPLVVGPLNGGMEFPPAFRRVESRWTRALIATARAFTDVANLVFRGKREAAALLVANQRTQAALPSRVRGNVVTLAENAVDPRLWTSCDEAPAHPGNHRANARFLFMGRLVDWKALDIVLDAFVATQDMELDVVGDGPMRLRWEAHVRAAGLGERVHFLGWQSQQACAGLLQRCTALVLPSLYESGGAVVLEAMAASRPVIAVAWGGPVDYVRDGCGLLLPPDSREALVHGFAEAMQRLAAEPELCRTMGEAGRARVLRQYTWPEKIEQMLTIYAAALNRSDMADES